MGVGQGLLSEELVRDVPIVKLYGQTYDHALYLDTENVFFINL